MKRRPDNELASFIDAVHEGIYRNNTLKDANEEALDNFNHKKVTILETFIEYISDRFSSLDANPVLAACKVLTIADWPTDKHELAAFGENEITTLSDHFQVPLEQQQCDLAEIQSEWRSLKVHINRQPKSDQSANVIEYHQSRFSNIAMLLEIVLLLPMSTAAVERGFSTMKRVKSDWRSSLVPSMLHRLMLISIEGPPLQEWNPDDAIARWYNDGNRRIGYHRESGANSQDE